MGSTVAFPFYHESSTLRKIYTISEKKNYLTLYEVHTSEIASEEWDFGLYLAL